MAGSVSATVHYSAELMSVVRRLKSPGLAAAAAKGLTEHAHEQRRQSVVRIAGSTGIPSGRISGVTRVRPATGGSVMEAAVVTKDRAIGLHEYGQPEWRRDLNPNADGTRGGPVSSMRGAIATAWNVRRTFPHSFIAGGRVVVRTSRARFPLQTLWAAVLPNELAKPSRPNVPAAAAYAAMDLERRITRHVIRYIGT